MRYRAVLFDLVGTLCDFPPSEFERLLVGMAEALAVPPPTFSRLWPDAYRRQELGTPGPIEETLAELAHNAGVCVFPGQVAAASALWREFQRRIIIPRPDALDTLDRLKGLGRKIGLIANQPVDVPPLWKEMEIARRFDAAVFSCEVRIRKPDPRIYTLLCELLSTSPSRCLFVGDGGSAELSGATRVGMSAVRIRVPYEDARIDVLLGREVWTWDTVAGLSEIPSIIVNSAL